MFLNPKVGRNKGCRYPLARISLRGWGRLMPTTSRLPVPYEVLKRGGYDSLVDGRKASRQALMVIFELYLRPGELETICC